MGIANIIEFGGVSSDVFDVVIEGAGEYTAPKRAFESISIPGRNGAFILDKGYYENADGKFKVVIQAATQLEFQRKVRDFKNAIVSQHGYQRLTEQYQPDTYRMATYKSGFDEEPKFIGKAAVFTLTFDCQPQRYWMDGETPIEVSDGDVIFNPTMFEAQPMLEVEGYGSINLNGREIRIIETVLGNVQLKEKLRSTGLTESYTFDASLVNLGDEITISGYPYSSPPECSIYVDIDFLLAKNADAYDYSTTGTNTSYAQCITAGDGTNWFASTLYKLAPLTFTVGTSASFTATFQSSFSTSKGSQTGTASVTSTTVVAYDGNNRIDVTVTRSITTDTLNVLSLMDAHDFFIVCTTTANSSVSTLGHPTYIDCDIGEAYKIVDDVFISLNRYIDLGSKLPELSPGNNEITFDNTITSLAVVPRWWEV